MTDLRLALVAASAVLLASCEYRVELDLGPEGQAAYRLAVRDPRLTPAALEGMVGMMQAPWLRVDRSILRTAGDGSEIVIEGSVDTMSRVGELQAFHGVRCHYVPLSGDRTLFQLARPPMGLRETEGSLVAQVRFPCNVVRTNGRKVFGDRTVAWRIPMAELAARELRLWAVLAPQEGGGR